MVTALVRNWRHANEMLVLAPTMTVANNCFTPAMGMVRADPRLATILKVVEHQRIIRHLVTGAELKVIAADAETLGGAKAGFVLIDELWLFGKNARAASMLMEATGGLTSRPEGFVVYLSTHADEAPRGVFKEKLDLFRGIRDGTIDDRRKLGVLYEFPEAMIEAEAYLDLANAYVTNPNLGRSVDVEFPARRAERCAARRGKRPAGVSREAPERRDRMRLSADRWTGAPFWERAADPNLADLDALLARCEVVVAGVDGGGLDDLLGLALIGREKGSKRWLIWAHAWAWDTVWQRRQAEATALDECIAEGSLTRCAMGHNGGPALDDLIEDAPDEDEDLTQDVRELVAILVKVRDLGLFPDKDALGLDAAGVAAIVDELARNGFTDEMMKAIPQGWKLSSAIKGLARKVAARTARHGGVEADGMVRRQRETDTEGASAVAIEKRNAGEKIDPVAAAVQRGDADAGEPGGDRRERL